MNENIRKMYEGSYLTFEGVNDFKEWEEGLTQMLKEEGIGEPQEGDWVHLLGVDVNKELKLTGRNKYPNDLFILGCSLEHLNVSKLAVWRLRFGARWFDDIVDNNLNREGTSWKKLTA